MINLKSFTIRDEKGNILIKLFQSKSKKYAELNIAKEIKGLVITGVDEENKKVYFVKENKI